MKSLLKIGCSQTIKYCSKFSITTARTVTFALHNIFKWGQKNMRRPSPVWRPHAPLDRHTLNKFNYRTILLHCLFYFAADWIERLLVFCYGHESFTVISILRSTKVICKRNHTTIANDNSAQVSLFASSATFHEYFSRKYNSFYLDSKPRGWISERK